ncbi:MAG: amino acid adenylation domain-containing protein, partial [Anaerolineales bacterium]
NPSFTDFLEQVRQTALEAFAYQDYPFELLVKHLQFHRDPSRSPIFQAMFVLQKTPLAENQEMAAFALGEAGVRFGLHGLALESLALEKHSAQFDLTLLAADTSDGLGFSLEYNRDLFDPATARRMLAHLEALLTGIVTQPDLPVDLLPLLPMAERQQLLVEWNATEAEYPQEKCIHELFEAQAEKTPEAVAVVFEDQQLTYAELDARANQLAHFLRSRGVGPDMLVGICIERSLEMVVGLLGILKAGGGYVPMDPSYPVERLEHMLADSRLFVLLTQEHLLSKLPQSATGIVCLDKNWETITREKTTPVLNVVEPDHLAYVIYTSGSTGKPKGTMIFHRTIVNHMLWMQNTFPLTDGDSVLQKTPFSFDASVWEFYAPLLNGARLVLARPGGQQDSAYLCETIVEQNITTLQLVPAMLRMLLAEPAFKNCRSLKRVFCGGEVLPEDSVENFFAVLNAELINLYGPTEATIDTTSYTCERKSIQRAIPIGRPIANVQIYLLDADLQPTPMGVSGELYIAGAGLARGYLHRPDLTAEKFIPNPYSEAPGARIYKSGDLARYLPGGNIEYLGRIDNQVKIRGFRIELGEIEAALAALPEVREVVVLAMEDSPGDPLAAAGKRLIAYLVPQAGLNLPENTMLRSRLAQSLPEYMLPAHFVTLDTLPLTPSGKVDRRALPIPDILRSEVGYVAPRNLLEAQLAQIWAGVLKLDKVSIHDNFFEMGGHSLLAIKLIEQMRQAGLTVDVRTLFTTPTIAELALVVKTGNNEVEVPPNLIPEDCQFITPDMLPLAQLTADEIAQVVKTVPGGPANIQDIYPLAPLQEGILFHHLMSHEGDAYLLPALLSFDSRERLEHFVGALQIVINRHDILRTAIVWDGVAQPVQVVWRQAPLIVEKVSFDGDDIAQQISARYDPRHTRLDVRLAPMMRGFITEDRANKRWLLHILFHHLVTDHTTLEFLLAEVQTIMQGREEDLLKPFPFRNFVAQTRLGISQAEHEAFFTEMLSHVDEPTAPFGLLDVQGDGTDIEEIRQEVDPGVARRLRKQARRLGVSAASLVHLAWAQVLARTTGRRDVVFGTVLFGRMQGGAGVDRVMGMFINTLPICISVTEVGAQESVRQTHGRLTQLLQHEHASLALAQRCSGVQAPTPLFSALLNYRYSANAEATPQTWKGMQVLSAEERTNYPLILSVDDLGEGFALTAQVVASVQAQRICDYMQSALKHLVDALEIAPQTPVNQIEMLSMAERQRLLVEWNAAGTVYPQDKCIHELFEAQVEKNPAAVAVVFEDQQLTYAELNARANQLAHYLRSQGVGPDVLVGICVERSLEMIVGLLGILKAGGAYVPLDPAYPPERLAYMLEDAKPAALLTHQHLQHTFPITGFSLDSQWGILNTYPRSNPQNITLPSNLAYVIYTSGSTGRPKGSLLQHANVTRLFSATDAWFDFDEKDAWSLFHSYAFDFSVWEIWGALLYGGKLVVVPYLTSRSPDLFHALLAKEKVTILNQTPSAFQQLVEVDLKQVNGPALALRKVIFGGEALNQVALAPWFERHGHDNPSLINMYGITETTVHVTYYPLQGKTEHISCIGRPIPDLGIYLLDAHLNPVPIGIPGELCITGDGLARGYLNRPDLTAEKFIPHPFSSVPGARMYRSGDLARYLPDGNLEYLGRIDSQLKIRGFRVELGEIEAVITQHPAVRAVVVIAREDIPGDRRLVAYLLSNIAADRVPFQAACQVEDDNGHVLSIILEDISCSGACLADAPDTWKLDQRLYIRVALLPTLDEQRLLGEVVWKQGNRVGVLFETSAAEMDVLRQSIAHLSRAKDYTVMDLRRLSPRVPLQEVGQVKWDDGQVLEIHTVDISWNGARIKGLPYLDKHQGKHVRIKLPLGSDGVWVDSTLIWQRDDYAGVRFEAAPDGQTLLHKTIGEILVGGNLSIGHLNAYLRDRLPVYMIPSAFVFMDTLPLTTNGKIDRKALPAPDMLRSEAGYVAPRNPVEEQLARIWADVLNLDKVGVNDNFFELGGHSLLAIKLIERMRQVKLSIDIRTLFTTPTIAALATSAKTDSSGIEIPANLITEGCQSITPEMLTLVHLTAEEIAQVVKAVPGGASNVQDIYPLAPLQEGMLFHHLMNQESDAYLLGSLLSFDSREHLDRFISAVQSVINRHDILRTAVVWEGIAEPVQVVWRQASVAIEDVQFDESGGDIVQQIGACYDPRRTRLDVRQAPMLRGFVAEDRANDRWLLQILFHHLIGDHTTLEFILAEVQTILQGREEYLSATLPFRDFVAQARLGISQAEQEAFFTEMLSHVDEPTAPFGLLDVQGDGSGIDEARRDIDPELAKRLRQQARNLGVSAASLMHLAWAQVLARITGRRDVVFGTVLFGRMQGGVGADRVMGMFINTLPVCILVGEASVQESVCQTHARLTQLLRYEHASLAVAQRCSGVRAPTPLFSALLNYRHSTDTEIIAQTWDGMQILNGEERTNYPIGLSVDDLGEGFSLTAQAVASIGAQRICDYMDTALKHLADALEQAPQTPANRIEILPAAERNQILVEWNATNVEYPRDKRIHELFEAQVEKTPEAVAVIFEGQQLTYAELNVRANRLAHYLRGQGVGPDVLVGISVERSIEMIVGLLGVLKAGGAYMPLDPAYPQDRLSYMLENAQPAILLTQAHLQQALPVSGFCLDSQWNTLDNYPGSNLPNIVLPGNLAYVIYTSGSTGRPKGVLLQHDGLLNLVQAQVDAFLIRAEQRILQFASFNFDASTSEIFMALSCGATLCLATRDDLMPGEKLDNTLQQLAINVVTLPPVALNVVSATLPKLETLIVAGEACPASLVAQWADNRHFFNAYGPTEATVCASIQPCFIEQAGPPPIGFPIANTQIYLLDAALNPVPVGVPGELYIAGDGLARGYLNRPDLTAEKFIPNPFSSLTGISPIVRAGSGARMYKSGDLARYLPDGSIEYLGRIDSQVKIRGFRIELGEIEAILANLPEVREVVVLAREDLPGDPLAGTGKRLVAYLVANPDANLSSHDLRNTLKTQLPDYMVPAAFVFIDQLPLTPNGKIDRKALPSPEFGSGLTTGYVAPRNDLEKIISQTWMEVLHVEKVGIHDNFFDMGGHSLLMARVHNRLREQLQCDLKMVELFQYPTVSALAGYLSALETDGSMPLAGALRAQLRRDLMKQPDDGIAVIGLAGRFAGAPDVDAFWQNLCAGKESITFFSEEELRAAGVENDLLSNPNYVKAGSVLENAEEFDPFFFGYNPREAALMDPQHRIFLESAWEALERAGYDSERYAGRIGVYASVSDNTYLLHNLLPTPGLMQSQGMFQTMLGNDKDFLTTHVSYKLNLTGPSVNVQTACSSSLVAIHQACQSLLRGESDMVLAGGVSISLPQQSGYFYEEGGIASPDGHCRAFDARAKGIVGGNGVGVVVLKRLGEALADGDSICAVIKGTAINNDGSLKVGYTAPSVEGQANVIAEAQNMAGVEPDTVTYVETHGTGTVLGDPIEVAALTKAFRANGNQQTGFCAIGSVKTNLGHLDAAAGVTGFMKTVLALQHRQIPPSLNFESPNPTIDFEHSPFYVNAALTHWPVGPTPRRAGVSSFGIGGTNAHAILEEAPPVEPSSLSRPWQLLLLSAKTGPALEKVTADLAKHLKTHAGQNPSTGSGQRLADTAYTLQVGRHVFEYRRAVACRDVDDAIATLENMDPRQVSTGAHEQKEQAVAFMFPGQGGQYVNMGLELYTLEPVFRELVDRCSALLLPHLGLDLRTILYPDQAHQAEAAEQLGQIWMTQPALFVIEYALAQLWISWGVKPQALIGHSSGEYAAACLAGVFSLEDALALTAARGRLIQSLPSGTMLAVPLSEAEIQPLLGNTLSLATINGPTQCVVSGSTEAVAAFEEQLKEKGVECRRLQISHASHSVMMEPILDLFAEEVKRVKRNPPQIPFVSNLTGEWITAAEATDPDYWVRHLRNTVRFGDGLEQLLKEPAPLLLEIGPGRILSSLAQKHPSRKPEQTVLSSLRHAQDPQSDQAFLLTALGKLWLTGVPVDWNAFYQSERRRRIPLPTYPFERQRCWIEPSKAAEQSQSDRIYKKKNIADWFYIPAWHPIRLRSKETALISAKCLVFVDGSSLGLALVERLKQKGAQVITVHVGVEWKQGEDDQYWLDPRRPEHYEQLFDELVKTQKTPDTIVHLWSLTVDEQASGPDYFTHLQPLGFNSLVYLTQALNNHNVHQPIHIEVLSNGVYTLEGITQPEKATILGPCKVIPQEMPFITCRYVDIVAPSQRTRQESRLVTQLIAQIFDKPANGTYLWRNGQLWEQGFEPLELQKETDDLGLLRENGVYLLIDGLENTGLVLAEYLIKRVKARLALTSQSLFPPREEWEQYLSAQNESDDICCKMRRLQAMEELGAEIILLRADVADQESMQAVISHIEQRWGSLNGVFHLAGALNVVNPLQELTTQHEAHFRPKVYGLFTLKQVLQERELDFCLLFSSLASVLGGVGLVSHSAADNFMDASARKYSQQGSTPWISVNWDAWQIAETQSNESVVGNTLNNLSMRPDEAMSVLQRILSGEQVESQIVVSTANLQARINKWIKPKALQSEMGEKQSEAVILQARPTLRSNYLAPRTQTEQTLASIWQELLGIEQIGIQDNFFELGGHSLLATQVISKIRVAFQVNLSLRTLFEAPSIELLAIEIDKEMQNFEEIEV